MTNHKIKTPASGTVYLSADGCWFRFYRESTMRPVVQPDESVYAYSHGGAKYRAAVEVIADWKSQQGWGE